MPQFRFYLVEKALIGFDLICLYLFARLEGAIFGFDLYLVICLFIIIIFLLLFTTSTKCVLGNIRRRDTPNVVGTRQLIASHVSQWYHRGFVALSSITNYNIPAHKQILFGRSCALDLDYLYLFLAAPLFDLAVFGRFLRSCIWIWSKYQILFVFVCYTGAPAGLHSPTSSLAAPL